MDEAEQLLDAVEKHIRSRVSAPGAHAMQAYHAYVNSRVIAMRGDLPCAIEFCLAVREHAPVENLALQLDSCITLGYEYFLNGDYANASPVLNETIRSGKAVGAVINTVAASCVLARLYANQGLLRKSYETYQMAAQSMPEGGRKHLGARSLVEIGIADVLCEWNDLDAALDHLRQGLDMLPMWDKADDLALAHITLARIHLARANIGESMRAVEKATQFIQMRAVFPEARKEVELAQVKLWLAQGAIQVASHWIASLQQRFGSDHPFGFENEVTHIAQAWVLVAQNRLNESIRLLSCLEGTARSGGRTGRLIEILILKALALQMAGDTTRAVTTLTESLSLAEPEGYMRIFLDEGGAIIKLLKQVRTSKLTPQLRGYVNRLLEAATSA